MQVERHGHVDPANGRREGDKEMDLSGIYWWKCHKNLDGICSNNNNIVLLLQDCQNYEQKPFTVLLYYRFNDCRMYSSAQFSPVTQSCPTLCDPMNRSTPGLPVHHQLPDSLKFSSFESVMPSSHLILCRPLLLLPPIPPSIRVFSNESTLRMRWPKFQLEFQL